MSFLGRVFLIIFHAFQFIISISGALYFSLVVAILLIGVQIYQPEEFLKTFKVGPKKVALIGTIIWLVIAVAEFPLDPSVSS